IAEPPAGGLTTKTHVPLPFQRVAALTRRGRRQMNRTTFALRTLVAAVLVGTAMPADAQESYPTRPIALMTPEVVGSAADLLSRIIGQAIGEAHGQPVTIDNLYLETGIEKAIKSPPDGYTLMYGSSGNIALLPHVKKVAFDPLKDLTPVGRF